MRMIPAHEAFAGRVAKIGAFAAKRFRKQKPRRAVNKQRGGMELDELDIADHRARTIRRRHAVAGGNVRVGRFLEYAAQPACCQQHGLRANPDLPLGRLIAAPPRRKPCLLQASRSVMAEKLWNRMFGIAAAFRYSVRAISLPVESPCACSTRLRLCAPSRANSRCVPSRSNSAPHSISFSIAAGPSSTSVRTASRSHNPSPAFKVSCSCSSTSSSSLSATAIPPCAYSEEDSLRLSLATTSTLTGTRQFDGRPQSCYSGSYHQEVRFNCLCSFMRRMCNSSILHRLPERPHGTTGRCRPIR